MIPIQEKTRVATARRSDRGHPAVPFLVQSGDWEIRSSMRQASVDVSNKLFVAPKSGSPKDVATRLHEYGHLKWSPVKLPHPARAGVSEESMRAVEDGRINYLLTRNDVPEIKHLHEESEIANIDPETIDKKALACYYFATMGTDIRNSVLFKSLILKTLTRDEQTMLEYLEHDLKDRPTFQTVKSVGKALDILFAEGEEGDEPGRIDKSILREMIKHATSKDVSWGKLKEVVICPLDKTVPGVISGFKRRPSDIGPFCHPYRVPPMSDGLVFSHKVKTKGGTVLVDGSGSMGLNPSQVDEMIQNAPSATVAIYSGKTYDGSIWILAKNGLACKQEKYPKRPGGNVIDGPALEWLIKQPKPHIWVCDGAVTGIGDVLAKNLIYKCIDIVKNNNIYHVQNTEDAIKLLRRLKRS